MVYDTGIWIPFCVPIGTACDTPDTCCGDILVIGVGGGAVVWGIPNGEEPATRGDHIESAMGVGGNSKVLLILDRLVWTLDAVSVRWRVAAPAGSSSDEETGALFGASDGDGDNVVIATGGATAGAVVEGITTEVRRDPAVSDAEDGIMTTDDLR